MKINCFLLTVLLTCATTAVAQKTERTIDGVTYICDTLRGFVYNKSNAISNDGISGDCLFRFEETEPLKEIYKKVFSKERTGQINAHSKKGRILLTFYCDTTGLILEIKFLFLDNYNLISLQEIKALEDQLKKYKFKAAYIDCPKQKYYRITYAILFKKLYSE